MITLKPEEKKMTLFLMEEADLRPKTYGHTLTLQTATLTPIEDTINESGVSELVREDIDM